MQENNTGFLIVNTRTALGALPVPGARVRVTGQGYDTTVMTDSSGVSGKLVLPTPPLEASLSPGGAAPYAAYDIEVEAEGYYTSQNRAVPIFPGITSVQSVNLMPLSLDGAPAPESEMLITDEGIPFGVEESE